MQTPIYWTDSAKWRFIYERMADVKNNNTELTVRIISTILMLIAISLLFVGLRKVAIIVFVVVLALDIAGIVIASKMDKK